MKRQKRDFRSLELTAKFLISNFGSGIHRSLLADSSGEVDITREYQPGDKRLDSKTSLRVGKVMSRVFNPEKLLNIFIVLDVSHSGFYGVNILKIEVGVLASLYLSFLAGASNDNVGLITFSDRVKDFYEPCSDETVVTIALEKVFERESKQDNKSNLELALKKLANLEMRDCLIFIISDFLFDHTKRLGQLLKQINLSPNNSSIALIVINEQEWVLPKQNFVAKVLDAESDRMKTVDFGSPKNFIRQKGILYNWRDKTRAFLSQSHCHPIFINTGDDNPLLPLIRYFLKIQN